MRIIAGKYKGKKLAEFELNSTRPTSDLMREAMFDKIGLNIVDSVFLDLFSGTGACGIEALSRNAKECYFVDKNKDAIKIIKKNLQSIGKNDENVFYNDFENVLNIFAKKQIKFDIVFLDPPYASDYAEKAIQILLKNQLLNDGYIIVWEHDDTKNDYIGNAFIDAKTKKYGNKYLTYIVKQNV